MSINGISDDRFSSNISRPTLQPQIQEQQTQPQSLPADSFRQSGNNSATPAGTDILKAAEILSKAPKSREAEINWSISLLQDGCTGEPVLADENHLVFSTFDKGFVCLNPTTKEILWERGALSPDGQQNNQPVKGTDNDLLLSLKEGKQVISVDPLTGKEKWHIELNDGINSSPIIGQDGNIHINHTEKVVTYDGKTHKKLSETPIRCESALPFIDQNGVPPAVGKDGTIYAGGSDGTFHAYENGTGKEKWAYKTDSNITVSPVLAQDGTVYCVSDNKKLVALDPLTGEKKWEFKAADHIMAEPSLGRNGEVILGSKDQNVYFLDPRTGSEKWRFQTDGEIHASPKQLKNGNIWVASNKNRIYGINPETGLKRWSCKTAENVVFPPDSDEKGNFYIYSNDSNMYSYKMPSTRQTMETLKAETESEQASNRNNDISVRVEDNFVVIGGIKLPKKQSVK
ncbi:MAG: PQQ-binding-like beta-propeller repeat protein [Firmicutes bacterium]|nr:PQQ-binding-like beta-propeller repeat protein [Bacillota bacterium]